MVTSSTPDCRIDDRAYDLAIDRARIPRMARYRRAGGICPAGDGDCAAWKQRAARKQSGTSERPAEDCEPSASSRGRQ